MFRFLKAYLMQMNYTLYNLIHDIRGEHYQSKKVLIRIETFKCKYNLKKKKQSCKMKFVKCKKPKGWKINEVEIKYKYNVSVTKVTKELSSVRVQKPFIIE